MKKEDTTEEYSGNKTGSTTVYRPPSALRVNVETGLRSALAAALAFLWISFGPFSGGLSFFAAVPSIACLGRTAGQTIGTFLMVAHGAVIGAALSFLPRWLLEFGDVPSIVGFFVSVFLIVRSRRLKILGKRFGCVTVTILAIASRAQGFPSPWTSAVGVMLRAFLEGGVCALLASLFPVPRMATRDVRFRLKFVSQSLSAAVGACVDAFINGRDARSACKAGLICEKVRDSLRSVRTELEWSRLEIDRLFCGVLKKGRPSADALEHLAQSVIRTDALRLRRLSLPSLVRLVNGECLVKYLRVLRGAEVTSTPVNAANSDDGDDDDPPQDWLAHRRVTCPEEGRFLVVSVMEQILQSVRSMRQSMQGLQWTRTQLLFARAVGPALREVAEAVEQSFDALSRGPSGGFSVLVSDRLRPGLATFSARERGQMTARGGHEAQGESANGGASSRERASEPSAASTAEGRHEAAAERLEGAMNALNAAYAQARRSIVYGIGDPGRTVNDVIEEQEGEDDSDSEIDYVDDGDGDGGNDGEQVPENHGGDGDGDDAERGDEKQAPTSSRTTVRSKGVFLTQLAGLRRRGTKIASYPSEVFRKPIGSQSGASEMSNVPDHVVAFKERKRFGGRAAMARSAFMFSLEGLCETLAKTNRTWRCSHASPESTSRQYAIFVLWEAMQPPPELWGAVRYVARCMRKSETSAGGRRSEAAAEAKTESLRSTRDCAQRWRDFTRTTEFWALKVSLALTFCALFAFSGDLSDRFAPAGWIPLAVAFVISNQSGSVVLSCVLRLLGTVLGAVYGIVTAKVTNHKDDDPYGWATFVILLPWIAVVCFFRNSKSYAYAAVVSAITAVMMFTGSDSVLGESGEEITLARIVNTVLGICIYLLVEILIVPTRARELVRRKMYEALDAALSEVSTNGERLFGTHTCPRIPTLALLRQSKQIRTDSVVRSGRLPPELVTLGSKISEMRESSISSSGGSRHRAPSPARQRSGDKARVSHGAESPEGVGDSAKEEQGGGNRRESAGDAQEGDERQGRRHDVGSNASDAERGRLGELAARGVKVPEPGVAPFSGEDQFGARDIEEGAAEVVKPPDDGNDAMLKAWDKKGYEVLGVQRSLAGGLAVKWSCSVLPVRVAASLQRLVSSLARQRQFLPMAEFEPQLWYPAFDTSAYQGMVVAEEELLRALTLMSRAAIAVDAYGSDVWRQEMGGAVTHLVALVQLMKEGLQDARDKFHRGWRHHPRSLDDINLLQTEVDVLRVNASLNEVFLNIIQAFLERGAFPKLEERSVARFHAAVFGVTSTQQALFNLGLAVAEVLDRESHAQWYRGM